MFDKSKLQSYQVYTSIDDRGDLPVYRCTECNESLDLGEEEHEYCDACRCKEEGCEQLAQANSDYCFWHGGDNE